MRCDAMQRRSGRAGGGRDRRRREEKRGIEDGCAEETRSVRKGAREREKVMASEW